MKSAHPVGLQCSQSLHRLNPLHFVKPLWRFDRNVSQALMSAADTEEERLTDVPNFRDLSSASIKIKKGHVMRCAQPIKASEEDIDKLLQQIGILELVDLRSGEEMMGDLPGSKLLSIAELQRHERCASGQVIPKEPILIPSKTLVRHNVSLLDRWRYYACLCWHLPFTAIGKALLLGALFQVERARLVLLQEVNAGGLGLLYKIILDSAQPEICAVMNLILKALKNARPVLIFCKAGKDRTGLISALILGVAGCSDEEIVADYIKSDSFRKVALAGIENKKELRGLDFSKFEGAPAEAMEEALLYIRSKYGSPSDYLVSIGFGEAVQTEMRLLLR